MGDLIGGLIVLLVALIVVPIVVMAALVIAGIAIAATLIGIVIHLVFWAMPLLIIFGLIWLIFGGRRREVARS